MIPNHSQASQTGDSIEDQRFAELLKPIKDLTQNWEVPLAELLSGYIDDMQHLTISLDGGQTSINFAQAALVLQGTTSVYSKKIEFLWKLVGDMLEMLRNKKTSEDGADGEDAGGGPGASKGRRRHNDLTTEFEYLTTDIGKNINMKVNEDETVKERKDKLNFIYITPRQLIEKEGSEQKSVKVNMFTGVANSKWDLLAAKEDFRVNSQYVMKTGYLGEELNVDNVYLNLVQEDTVGDNTGGGDFVEAFEDVENENLAEESSCADEPVDREPLEEEQEVGQEGRQDVSVVSERAAGQNMSRGERERDLLRSPPPTQPQGATEPVTPEPVQVIWEPLDPHLEMTTPKPMKVRPTRRLPPSLMKKYKPDLATTIVPISEYLNQQMNPTSSHSAASRKLKMFCMDLPPVLYDRALDEMERRKAVEREERRDEGRRKKGDVVRRQIFEDEEGGEGEGNDVEANNVMDEEEEDDNGSVGDDLDDFQLPDPHLGGDLGALVVGEVDENPSNESENVTLSYEELVARKVEEFALRSQEYMRSSELSQKVAKWHEMIGPRLESLERRKPFDIHAYGSRVIIQCEDNGLAEVPFNDVIRGQKKEEISRFFLSTLMLANTGNVEIFSSPHDQIQVMDNINLRLLSTARHHQRLEEFQPLSQTAEADENFPQASQSRGEKRNVSQRGSVSPQQNSSPKKKNLRRI